MGYVFDFNAAKAYEKWCEQPQCRPVIEREHRLMIELLEPMHMRRVLDIGCGFGGGLAALLKAGINVTGLDPSPYMLDMARTRLGHRAEYHQGVAEDLPFEDHAFHYACLSKTLEFVDSPEKALAEAFRVAKDRVYIGLINKHAFHSDSCAEEYPSHLCDHARFLSLGKLKRMIRNLLGDVPIAWKSLCDLPSPQREIAETLTRVPMFKQMPIGMYTGVVVTLTPRFTVTPLPIPYGAKEGSPIAG